MTVITISRQYGSGGDEVALRVCEMLGYRLFDKHHISRAAVEAGLSEQEAIDYSEDNYKVKNFLDRLLRRPVAVAHVRVWKEDARGVPIPETQPLSEAAALNLVQKAVQAAYNAGGFVILGRGGQIILEDKPDVLHVRIEAPLEERIQRVKQQLKEEQAAYYADVGIRRAAQDLILARDAASAEYIKQFYGRDWDDPSLYHAVLNTGRLGIEKAAEVIAAMVRILFP